MFLLTIFNLYVQRLGNSLLTKASLLFAGFGGQRRFFGLPRGSPGQHGRHSGRSPTEPGELPIDIGFIFNNATRQVVKIFWCGQWEFRKEAFRYMGLALTNDHSE